jgi:hypothetical protein
VLKNIKIVFRPYDQIESEERYGREGEEVSPYFWVKGAEMEEDPT